MESHYLKTLELLENEEIILKIQDTTSLDFTSQKAMKDIGYYSQNGQGLLVHTTLAVTGSGLPIGIINQKVWSRDNENRGKGNRHKTSIEYKESYKWLESMEKTEKMFLNTQLQVMIGDREADIYDLFAMNRNNNSHFLVRGKHDRSLINEHYNLFKTLDNLEIKGHTKLEIGRGNSQKSRIADLNIKYDTLNIKGTKLSVSDKTDVLVNVILVEESTVSDGLEPIKWLLLTSLEIESLEDVLKYVKWYSYRWLIERFHYVLKSGCKIEDLQLDSGEKVKRAIPIYSIIACNLLNLTYKIKKDPEILSETIFERKEWELLYILVHKNNNLPKESPTLREIVRWIAKLGGFLARKGDGEPGVKNIWRGYRKFINILESVNLLHQIKDLSN